MNDVSHPGDYERSDADPRLIAALALVVAIFLAMTPIIITAIYPGARHPRAIPVNLPQPPEPRLQLDPKADLARLRARDDARLTTYGWVDRDGQLVRIPIGRAIELLVSRGLPDWPSAPLAAESSSR